MKNTKNKKPKIWIPLAALGAIALASGGIIIGRQAYLAKARDTALGEELLQDNPLKLTMDEPDQMKTIKRFASNDGFISETISYNISPSGSKDFDTLLYWDKEENSDYDWAYYGNRSVEDYVTYQLDTVKQTITFTCRQAFGRRLRFLMSPITNPAIKTGLSIDYERKVLSAGNVQMTDTDFREGQGIQVETMSATYSIGTQGLREDKIEIVTDFDGSGTTLRSLLGDCSNPSTYSYQTYYVGDKVYMTTEKYKDATAKAVDDYLRSIITTDGSKTFSQSALCDLLTYQYVQYRTYEDVKGTVCLFYDFIDNYQAAYIQGSGYRVRVLVNDEEKLNVLLNIDIEGSSATQFSLGASDIVF